MVSEPYFCPHVSAQRPGVNFFRSHPVGGLQPERFQSLLQHPPGQFAQGQAQVAFGAGVLISAVSFELVEEAFDTTLGEGGVGLGLIVGSVTFFLADRVLDRYGGAGRVLSSTPSPTAAPPSARRPTG